MPAVDVFNARVRVSLDTPLTTDAQGGLAPTMLDLTPAAHAAWVQAHDHIERQPGGAGHYASIRDVAAKAAENIARLAALLHALGQGPAGDIDESSVESASRIIDRRLHEARRLLADLDAPPELSAAIRFDARLRDEALRTGDPRIASAHIYQYGPGCVRDSKALEAALALLDERGRARVEQEGRHRFVVVNPALLAGLPAEAWSRVPPGRARPGALREVHHTQPDVQRVRRAGTISSGSKDIKSIMILRDHSRFDV